MEIVKEVGNKATCGLYVGAKANQWSSGSHNTAPSRLLFIVAFLWCSPELIQKFKGFGVHFYIVT
jgi:hypothetical protein